MMLRLKYLDRICLCLVLMASAACGYWTVNEITLKKKQIRQENDLISHRLNDLNLAQANLQQLEKALDDTKTAIEALNEKIPQTAMIGAFLKKVDGLAKTREITMINIEPLAVVDDKLYTRLPIRMIFKGSFMDIHQLLCDFETMSRILVMEKINISKTAADSSCKVDLTACVFERSASGAVQSGNSN
jgi:Tfp pilus assembly protein PilO